MKKFLIKSGCRNSKLSLVQTKNALNTIQKDLPNLEFEIIGIKAFGDKHKDLALDDPNTPADIWTRELDEMIINDEITIAIHSAKDLPPTLHPKIDFFWLPWAEEPGDVLLFQKGITAENLPTQPIVAVSSDRRTAYVQEYYPSAILKPIRGTIEERIAQLDQGDFDILIMAEAALNRLGLQSRISIRIPLEDLPPPEGQGKIAITFKKGNSIPLTIRDLYVHPISFVGAGPGDPELLTIKGKKALENADCVLYDALANHVILDFAPISAEKVYVGKRSGQHSKTQEEITKLIVTKAKQGKTVVRLKGGDPSIFGRLAEELTELQEEAVPYRIIPGVSALNGVTSEAGVLLTARGINQSFLTATATTETLQNNYFQQYASLKQPTIFFMGLKQLSEIVSSYTSNGWSKETPIAIISQNNGTIIVRGTLENIEEKAKASVKLSPALIAIGDFASNKNDKRSPLPILKELRILLPGVKESIFQLAERITNHGGTAIPWQLVKLECNKNFLKTIKSLSAYNVIILASPAAVRFFFAFVIENQITLANDVEFAVTGPGTAQELASFGRFATYIPKTDYSSIGLIERLKQADLSKKQILIPRSDIGGKAIENYLSKHATVTSTILYFNTTISPEKELPHFDSILFTSPSGAQSFYDIYGAQALQNKIIGVIGNVTAAKTKQLNINVNFIANENNIKGLVHSLAAYIQNLKFSNY